MQLYSWSAGEIILLFMIYIYWCMSQVTRAHFIQQELHIINFHIIKQLGAEKGKVIYGMQIDRTETKFVSESTRAETISQLIH